MAQLYIADGGAEGFDSGGEGPRIRRPNHRLAGRMAELGVSNKGLARRMREYSERDGGRRLGTQHTAIARYVSGEYGRPQARTLQVLLAVLSDVAGRSIDGAEVGWPTRPSGSEHKAENIGSPLLTGGSLSGLFMDSVDDPSCVDHLRILFDERVRMDALTGPRYALATIGAELSLIENLCGKARGEIRENLLVIGARFCEFAGWLYQDAGDVTNSMYWTNTAMDYAEELGDAHLTSYILGRKSNIATERGYAAKGLGLANAALRHWDAITPELRAVALRQRANAFAMTGETDECRRALDDAMAEVLSIDETSPRKLALYCTPSYIEMEAAHSWTRLGHPERAIETYISGLSDWPAEQRRDKGLCTSRLAAAYANIGEFEKACRTGTEAVGLLRSAPSARTLDVLREVSHQVTRVKSDAAEEYRAAITGLA